MADLEIQLLSQNTQLSFEYSRDNATFNREQRDEWLTLGLEQKDRLILLVGKKISDGANSKVIIANTKLKEINTRLKNKIESLNKFVETTQMINDLLDITDIFLGLSITQTSTVERVTSILVDPTSEEIAIIKSELWADPTESEISIISALSVGEYLVAEGDSWFDYLPEFDILDNLKKDYGYGKLIKISQAGDTLDNMVYGTKLKPNWQRDDQQIDKTLIAVKKYKPKVFLFSGGGNDLAGSELDAFFNHADAKLPSLIRKDYLEFIIFTVFKKSYLDLIAKIHDIDPEIHIISHGYGHPIPNGRAVINLFGYGFIGPWLRPTFARKNIVGDTICRDLIKQLIDRFNDMLQELDDEIDKFHYLDLRSIINDEDWVNELHLSSSGYNKVASIFDIEIKKYL